MSLTTVLYILVLRNTWKLAWWKTLPFGIFVLVDVAFLGANAAKIPNGGWVALIFGFAFASFMIIWFCGERRFKKVSRENMRSHLHLLRDAVKQRFSSSRPVQGAGTVFSKDYKDITFHEEGIDVSIDLNEVEPPWELPEDVQRVRGMGIYFNPTFDQIPNAFQLFVNYIHAVPETIVFVTLKTAPVPVVPLDQQVEVQHLGEEVWRINAQVGYTEGPIEIDHVIRIAMKQGLPEKEFTTYYDMPQIVVGRSNFVKRWVYSLYATLKKVFVGIHGNYQMPRTNVVSVGVQTIL